MVRSWCFVLVGIGAFGFAVEVAGCTSFGAAEEADGAADGATSSAPIDGAVALSDGALVSADARAIVDGHVDASTACKVPAGMVDPSFSVIVPVGGAVAAQDPASGAIYVAGTEDCLADGMRRTAIYRVPVGGGPGARIACVGEAFEAPLAIDADATGLVVGTRFLAGGLFSARLYRLDAGGAPKGAPSTVTVAARANHPTAVKRAGANDIWAYFSPAPATGGVAAANLKVEPGGRLVALGEVPIVAMSGVGPLGIATVEVDLSASALGVRVGRWNLAGAQLSRDLNDEPARFLPSSAPSQAESYPFGVLHAAPTEQVVGFTVGAQAFATYVGPRGTKPFTVGPVGAATGRAPVALLCDGSLVLGHSESVSDRGRVTRFPVPTSAAVDSAFAPVLPTPPTQLFPQRDGTLFVLAAGPLGSTIARLR